MLVANPERLLVKPVEQESRTVSAGGLHLPTAEAPQPMVEIVDVGVNVNGFEVGDHCLVSTYGGVIFKWEDEQYYILTPGEILCIVRR